jgi:hypothetical protein
MQNDIRQMTDIREIIGRNGHSIYEVEPDADVQMLHRAEMAFSLLLVGDDPEPKYPVGSLGPFDDCYRAMLAAYDKAADGNETAAVRAVLDQYIARDPLFADMVVGEQSDLHKRSWSVSELYATEFPEPRYLVPGLLPAGLAALGARPKIGKSWMALQMSVAIGIGAPIFDLPTLRGRVLYLALEDSPRRMKSRLQRQRATEHTNVRFEFTWPPLWDGGIDELLRAIDRHRYALVVIDTLARAVGYLDPNKAAEMNVHLGTLQRMAVERNMTILLIDHHRKGNGGDGDVIDDLIGATAKSGVLDVAMGLYRNRGEKNATLKLTGRDIEERELAMRFDHETGCWECLGDAEEIVSSEHEKAILEAVSKLGAPTHREITDVTGQDRSHAFRRIQELIHKGRLRQIDGRPARFMVTVD